jgi:glycine cleavage system H protein
MKYPDQLHYSPLHLWVKRLDNDTWEAGITDYAQDLLGDIVFVQLPQVETVLTKDTPCGLVESVKTGSDLHAPLSGIVTEVNETLSSAPEALNDKPYQAWIFRFKATTPDEAHDLLDAEAYSKLVEA